MKLQMNAKKIVMIILINKNSSNVAGWDFGIPISADK